MAGLSNLERLGVFKEWGGRCTWCQIPIYYSEMEVEHIIPKSLKGAELDNVLKRHALPETFELDALENLTSSCRPCNSKKGRKPPPEAPAIKMVLEEATAKAPDVRRMAERGRSQRKLEEAVAVLREAVVEDEQAAEQVRDLAALVAEQVKHATGEQLERLHPAVELVYGDWVIVKDLGQGAAVVSDGSRTARTGTDLSWMCGYCRSHGPWDGNRCLVCGHLSDPWD